LGQSFSNAVDQEMAVACVQFGAFQDQNFILAGKVRVFFIEVELSVLGEHDAVDGMASFSQHLNPFYVLFDRGPRVVGRHGMAMHVQVQV